MRYLIFIGFIALFSCGNNRADMAKTFCDTTCFNDTVRYAGDHKLKPYVTITMKNCAADTITWSHEALPTQRQMQVSTMLERNIRLRPAAMDCYIKDTSYAWLQFNDCETGRGYLMKLPFNKKESISTMKSALTRFDKKFVIPEDLRAYADYSMIYVVDVNTGKKEQMTFQEELKIDFDKLHKTFDSINVSHNRIYVVLNKDGKKVPLEKSISL
ncbi:MAG: hypothetical protein ICV84_22365 [Flavisolibacter sp.]|nr:hypothetical protein [Flavisolibacter sp.]